MGGGLAGAGRGRVSERRPGDDRSARTRRAAPRDRRGGRAQRQAAGGQPAAAIRASRPLSGRGGGRRAGHVLGPPRAPNAQRVDASVRLREGGARGADGRGDAVIAQGCEAGGHVRGTTPAIELLAAVRDAVGEAYPVLLAGGIATAADVAARLRLGAEAAVCGTIFLMSDESGAHPRTKNASRRRA